MGNLILFEILLTKTFAGELKKMESQIKDRVKKKIEIAKQDPFLYFERLKGHELFKLRIGKYRIMTQINPLKKQIILLSICHRKNAYEKL